MHVSTGLRSKASLCHIWDRAAAREGSLVLGRHKSNAEKSHERELTIHKTPFPPLQGLEKRDLGHEAEKRQLGR